MVCHSCVVLHYIRLSLAGQLCLTLLLALNKLYCELYTAQGESHMSGNWPLGAEGRLWSITNKKKKTTWSYHSYNCKEVTSAATWLSLYLNPFSSQVSRWQPSPGQHADCSLQDLMQRTQLSCPQPTYPWKLWGNKCVCCFKSLSLWSFVTQ